MSLTTEHTGMLAFLEAHIASEYPSPFKFPGIKIPNINMDRKVTDYHVRHVQSPTLFSHSGLCLFTSPYSITSCLSVQTLMLH